MGLWDFSPEVDFLKSNTYLNDSEAGFFLLTRLLSVNLEQTEANKKLGILKGLIDLDYMELARQEDLPNEAEVFRDIRHAFDTIEEMVNFPYLVKKHIVAIGGGFSAGKSQFVNSILHEELLPTDTIPTTSIPTYVAKGNFTNILAYNIFRNKIKLDYEALQAMTHAFSEQYAVGFSKMLKYIILQCASMPYPHLCFLDTPGYTKSDTYKTDNNTDEYIAREHLSSADYLIWVVDIEKGTIPHHDIEFIRKLHFELPIFFVFNKADKKLHSDIERILQTSEATIENAGIKSAGITAYSSVDEMEFVNESLHPFLQKINEQPKEPHVFKEFERVFEIYKKHHVRTILVEKKRLSFLTKAAIFNDDKGEAETEDKEKLYALRNESRKKIRNFQRIYKEFEELSKTFKKALKDILEEIQNNRARVERESFLHHYQTRILESVLHEAERLKQDFVEKYQKTIELFDITQLQEISDIEETFEKEIEKNICAARWYNPFSWNSTKVIKEIIPVTRKHQLQVLNASKFKSLYSSMIEEIYKEVNTLGDEIERRTRKLALNSDFMEGSELQEKNEHWIDEQGRLFLQEIWREIRAEYTVVPLAEDDKIFEHLFNIETIPAESFLLTENLLKDRMNRSVLHIEQKLDESNRKIKRKFL